MKKEQYGWVICFACMLMLFCTSGLASTGFNIYQSYLISVRKLTNTQASVIPTIRNLFGVLGMQMTSMLFTKFEVRRVSTAGMFLCGSAFLIFGITDGIAGCYIASAVAGIAYGIGGVIAASVLITRWFNEHRGLALGICMGATGISATVASPIISYITQNYSLTVSFLGEAIVIYGLMVIVYTLLRSNPSCLHVKPIGAHTAEKSKAYANHNAPRGLYIWMLGGIILYGAGANTLHPHLSVLYLTNGYTSAQIASLISVFGFALAVGKCVYGEIADKIGTYRASWIFYTLVTAGTILCCFAGNQKVMIAIAAVILLGFGLAVNSVSISMYAAKVSTEEKYSQVVSTFQMGSILGSLIFGTVPGIMADAMNNNYIPAYRVMLSMVIVGAVIMQTGYLKIRKADRQSAE